jgi:RNA polymerase sigma factor (sigma-70 family)
VTGVQTCALPIYLPPQRRIIFKLSFLEGMKNAEIANQLNLSLQTVQNQKAIALKFLRITVLNEKACATLSILACCLLF